jgi:hypothetical protein
METLKFRGSGMQILLMCGEEVVCCITISEYLHISAQQSKLKPQHNSGE